MKSSQTHAASRPHINKSLAKMCGQPHDITSRTGGDISGSSKAAGRSQPNSTISGKHFFEAPNDFASKAIGGGG
jgi:hypothetical protein